MKIKGYLEELGGKVFFLMRTAKNGPILDKTRKL